jgi:hypothetical protein
MYRALLPLLPPLLLPLLLLPLPLLTPSLSPRARVSSLSPVGPAVLRLLFSLMACCLTSFYPFDSAAAVKQVSLLQEGCAYANGYDPDSPPIKWLWKMLHELSTADLKRFLNFVTGSDRVPIKGKVSLLNRNLLLEDASRVVHSLTVATIHYGSH